MIRTVMSGLCCGALAISAQAAAQDESAPAIELGNGKSNWIIVDDLTREADSKTYTEVRTTEAGEYIRRADGVTLTFSEVMINGDG